MAGGWPSRNEGVPVSDREWKKHYLPSLRILFDNLCRAVTPQPVKVVILPGVVDFDDKFRRIIDALDESFGDAAEIYLLDAHPISDKMVIARQFLMDSDTFASCVAAVYGAAGDLVNPSVPGAEGTVTIPYERIRHFEEDFCVLHSAILSEGAGDSSDPDAFWRGLPPSWSDLQAGVDVRRSNYKDLTDSISTLLAENRNHTIEMRHSPGAGGTTASLRVAWDLRAVAPTVILLRNSKLTLDRLDELCHIAGRSILIVADSSVLSVAAREDLFRGLASRNSRAVLLHVVRTWGHPSPKPFDLFDPMKPDEAITFYKSFSTRPPVLADDRKQKELYLVAHSPERERYRSPFFFGLLAYERNLTNLDGFVASHLSGADYPLQKAIRYLALITRYSQSGLDEGLFLAFLDMPPISPSDLEATVGDRLARLIVRRGRELRLVHPIIAEEALRQLLGGGEGWRVNLKELSLDFIRDVSRILGSEAEETTHLFVNLFIRRDEWFGAQRRGAFAEVIEQVSTPAGQAQVFGLLTEVCPKGAHYWNHRGRHHVRMLKQDYATAATYLKKAVELEDTERMHHHSLGMVYRFWVVADIEKLLKSDSESPAEKILGTARERAELAFGCFGKTRELAPEDNHGYITHIQLVLHIAERLIRASGATKLDDLINPSIEVREWLHDKLVVAEDLLARVQHLRADSKESRYELTCRNKLTALYGNYEALIKSWEAMLRRFGDNSSGNNPLRRALAIAYQGKSSRRWEHLSESELRRVADLMAINLSQEPINDRDLRTWFQAYRRLPEFSMLEVLDRLQSWADHSNSLEANYYLYIVHFLLLRRETEPDETQTLAYIEKCASLAGARRSFSYEWLALSPAWCPLANHQEVGEIDRESGPINATNLARVNGTISYISVNRRSGLIRIQNFGRLRAFFVPSATIWQGDINTEVNFYLGFAYEGLRAWYPQLGHVTAETAERSESVRSIVSDGIGSATTASAPAKRTIAEMLEIAPPQQNLWVDSGSGRRPNV